MSEAMVGIILDDPGYIVCPCLLYGPPDHGQTQTEGGKVQGTAQ